MNNAVIDLIIRIKNGYLAKKEIIEAKYSRVDEEILKKLKQLGFVKDYQTVERKISIELLYKNKLPVLTDIQIFSKPGRRYYVSYKDLKPVLGGLGYSIISTSKGVLSNKEARKIKIGGELLFNIW